MGHHVPDTKGLWQPQGLQMGKKIPQSWVFNPILQLPEGSWYLPGQEKGVPLMGWASFLCELPPTEAGNDPTQLPGEQEWVWGIWAEPWFGLTVKWRGPGVGLVPKAGMWSSQT